MSDKGFPEMNFFALWRDWFIKSEGQWNEVLSEFMKDERIVEMMGKEMQQAVFMQKMAEESMQRYLAAVNLPSRLDLEKLGDRVGKMEDGLAKLQAEIVQLRSAIIAAGAVSPDAKVGIPRPPRTRKPVKEG